MLVNVMHTVASALQAPVIVLLIALVAVMVVIVGMLVAEFFTEHRYFKLSMPRLIDALDDTDNPEEVVKASGLLGRQQNALCELLHHPNATPSERESLAVNLVAQEQRVFDNRVKVTDLIAKVSPMLGLMGTLIPLGPGILAIGEGETSLLAESLLVAFDTTVLGLIVAVVALSVSTVRKSWYAKYMAAFEAATECVLEKANALGPDIVFTQEGAEEGAQAGKTPAGDAPAGDASAGDAPSGSDSAGSTPADNALKANAPAENPSREKALEGAPAHD